MNLYEKYRPRTFDDVVGQGLTSYRFSGRIGVPNLKGTTMARPRAERIEITCPICGIVFTERASRHRKFCSKRCTGKATGTLYASRRPVKTCLFCGTEYATAPHRKESSKFCSRLCQNRFYASTFAKDRGNLLRGTGEGKTYIKQDGRHQHRVVAESKLGRKLAQGEVVHHLNGDFRDNRPENLAVLDSQATHARIHARRKRT